MTTTRTVTVEALAAALHDTDGAKHPVGLDSWRPDACTFHILWAESIFAALPAAEPAGAGPLHVEGGVRWISVGLQEALERLDEPPFGHHIKGSPRDGEWRCTCGYGDCNDDSDTAEQHIIRAAVAYADEHDGGGK